MSADRVTERVGSIVFYPRESRVGAEMSYVLSL